MAPPTTAPPSASAWDTLKAAGSAAGEVLSAPSGAVGGFLSGSNPADSFRGAIQGFQNPDFSDFRDIGFVRGMSDKDVIGSLSPRDIAGGVSGLVLDPLNAIGAGRLDDAVQLGARGAGKAAGAARRAAGSEGVQRVGARLADETGSLSFGRGPKPPEAPRTRLGEVGPVSRKLFGIEAPESGLSRTDRAMNAIKDRTGIGVPEDELATPIMRERARVRQIVDSQAARVGALADDAAQAFKLDKKGRIPELPGTPTIQDVAARLPEYAPLLTPKQLAAMKRLQAEISPFAQSLKENGVELRSRADVMEGGFYLPRGKAGLEGADEPIKVGTGRGGAGGKRGFERGAVFKSMSEGVDAGYEYAPFKDALQAYARDAGTRSIDSWAANALKATGEGEGVKERLMKQAPKLVADWQRVNKEIVSLRGRLATAERRAGVAGGKADELDHALAEAQRAQPEGGARPLSRIPTNLRNATAESTELSGDPRNREFAAGMSRVLTSLDDLVPEGTERIRFLDTAIARTERRIDVLEQRGGRYGALAAGLRKQLDEAKARYDELAPEYRRAFEHAQATPREQGAVGFSTLNGTTFPDEMANVANKYLNKEKPVSGAGAITVQTVEAVNSLMRGLRASADVSSLGLQLLLGAARHPNQYRQAATIAIKALGDEQAFPKFLTSFDKAAEAAGRPTSQFWNAMGNRLGGEATEFQIGRGLPRIGQAIQNAPVIKQSNRSFGVAGDAMRLLSNDALYKARSRGGKQVSEADMQEMARFSNLMTGWASWRAGGDVGGLVSFAPRFFASQLELTAKALSDKGIVGQEARRSLATLFSVGALLTFAANEARGKETSWVPTDPNFLRIRDLAGQDISLFGQYGSLIQTLASLGSGETARTARRFLNSPTASMAWDQITGKSFVGEDTRNPEYIIRQFLPFSLSDIGRKDPAAIAVGATGLKATPLSNTERVQEGEYFELDGGRQFKALGAQSWKAVVDKAPPDIKKAVSGYESHYEWKQALTDYYVKAYQSRGLSEGEARTRAEQAANKHPAEKAYAKAKDAYETKWITDHPQDALKLFNEQAQLPWSERTWTPTKAQRELLYKLTQRQQVPVESR